MPVGLCLGTNFVPRHKNLCLARGTTGHKIRRDRYSMSLHRKSEISRTRVFESKKPVHPGSSRPGDAYSDTNMAIYTHISSYYTHINAGRSTTVSRHICASRHKFLCLGTNFVPGHKLGTNLCLLRKVRMYLVITCLNPRSHKNLTSP